jgi:hypothetical protein
MIEHKSDISNIILDTSSRRVESYQDDGISFIRTTIKQYNPLTILIYGSAHNRRNREIEPLGRLEGTDGIPNTLHIEKSNSYISECPECVPVTQRQVNEHYFDKAIDILTSMYKKGVLPLELKEPRLYVDNQGDPIIMVGTTFRDYARWDKKDKLTLIDHFFDRLYNTNIASVLEAKHKLIPGSRSREATTPLKEAGMKLNKAYVAFMMFIEGYRPV